MSAFFGKFSPIKIFKKRLVVRMVMCQISKYFFNGLEMLER